MRSFVNGCANVAFLTNLRKLFLAIFWVYVHLSALTIS